MRTQMAFAALLVVSACRNTTDYTPQIPVAPGATGRMLWIESLGLSSAPSVLPKPHAAASSPMQTASDQATEDNEGGEDDASVPDDGAVAEPDAGVPDAGAKTKPG